MLCQITHCTELNASQMPGDCPGGGMGGFGIDWYISLLLSIKGVATLYFWGSLLLRLFTVVDFKVINLADWYIDSC